MLKVSMSSDRSNPPLPAIYKYTQSDNGLYVLFVTKNTGIIVATKLGCDKDRIGKFEEGFVSCYDSAVWQRVEDMSVTFTNS